ncbi:DUF5624 domain-containing protein [Streptomyces niveus]|uniref:DUF5624 domain-containing protein n=1 Tax=Streptomyces niveus TaxID=193462 RepID=UPI002E32961C|nr:DUF5624 domain-containing protein [Streptomyces niveus]
MAVHESPELIDLFTTYTAGPDSIGAHLREAATRAADSDPLLVVTGADMALYPGDGRPPTVLGFRLSTRGFKELAAVSHLGPALASLASLREQDPGADDDGDGSGTAVWRADAERLLSEVRRSRAANSPRLWRDVIAAPAYAGRERAIAAMVDHSCAMTERFLLRSLDEPSYLNHRTLRECYLEDGDDPERPVSFNRVMVATFFLVGMDTAHRLISWCDSQAIDWSRTMVVIAGQQGRPTAGVTWRTSSVAAIVLAASRGELPLDRLYMAPHAPVFRTPVDGDLGEVAALEPVMRALWSGTRATVELGASMFDGYPAFSPGDRDAPGGSLVRHGAGATLTEMPAIRSPDDWFTLVSRLRLVMEDPRQLLSGAVSDYAAQQLVAHANDPLAITVPGLDGEPYPEPPYCQGQFEDEQRATTGAKS